MVRGSLAAIVFTDMVGYASMAQRNESQALEFLEEQSRVLRSVLPKFDGREIKTIGDGFRLEFASALQTARYEARLGGFGIVADKSPSAINTRICIHIRK